MRSFTLPVQNKFITTILIHVNLLYIILDWLIITLYIMLTRPVEIISLTSVFLLKSYCRTINKLYISLFNHDLRGIYIWLRRIPN